MAADPMHIPQGQRIRLRSVLEPGHAGNAFGDLALRRTGCAQSAQITLHIGREHRNAGITERLDQALQRYCLAGAGSTRDQTMAIGQAKRLPHRLAIATGTQYEL